MRFMLLGTALLMSACQPVVPASSTRLTSGPAPKQSAAVPVRQSTPASLEQPAGSPVVSTIKPLEWPRVPVTRFSFHESIWVENIRTPEQAAALAVGDALNVLGASHNPAALVPAALPKQPAVAWAPRRPDVKMRVVMDMEVVLTRGYLEHLLSRSQAGKDHESILSAPFDAEQLKSALVGIGLKPGKPATFVREENGERIYDFKPATGDVVKVFVQYEDDKGKTITVPAQAWIAGRDNKTLEADWVFAGSFRGKGKTFQGEEYDYFGANDGRVVCVTNYGTALLDLPFESVDADPQGNQLGYRAYTEVMPPRGTLVRVLFEPKAGK